MKKIFYVSIAVIACIVFASACQRVEVQEEISAIEDSESTAVMQTFVCSFDDFSDDTRVAIATDGKTTWVKGDKILVHGEYIGTKSSKLYSTVITLDDEDIIEGGKKAVISFPVDETGVDGLVPYTTGDNADYVSTFYAAYPADAHVQTNGKHAYYYSDFIDTNHPLMVAYNNEGEFIFKNICAAISFIIPDTFSFDSFFLEGNNGEIIGYDAYSTRYALKKAGSLRENIPYSDRTSGPKTEITSPIVCDGVTRNFVYIPIADGASDIHFSKGFTIKFVKDGEVIKYARNKNDYTLNMGDYLNLGTLNTPIIKDYSSPIHSPASWTSSATDLSASGSANSYIVYHESVVAANADKAFKIKAVQGNSSTSVGSIESVDVFWETYNTDDSVTEGTVLADIDFDASYIYFKMPKTGVMKSGNALIVAKNSAKKILWSWHIWVPESTINNYSYGDLAGANLMDRNLGALIASTKSSPSTLKSLGLLYQWGRKEPFVGARAFADSPSKAKVTKNEWSRHPSQFTTISESIANPAQYAYIDGESDHNDWLSTANNNLWNNSGSKTIYDPCPYGYRVPIYNNEKALWAVPADGLTGWTFNPKSENSNYWFAYTSSDAAFPYTGYVDCWGGSLSCSGYRSIIWSATAYDSDRAYCMEARSDKTKMYYNDHNAKAKGGSVRCVVYASEPLD